MDIYYLPKFIRQYKKLAEAVKEEAENKEAIFIDNPFDPRLNTHKLHGPLAEYYSFSINRKYRIIFDFDGKGGVRFYEVGNHDIYD